jgi:hypothetical protein
MFWLFVITGSLAGLVTVVVVIGLLLPQNHSSSRTARFKQPAEAVWRAISDHANEPAWRTDIAKKERLDDINGRAAWCETSKRGERMTFEMIAVEPPRRLVSRIADRNLPFGGTWTYLIEPTADGCKLTIIEDGEIYSPVFRFVARFIIGYRGTMDRYLAALSRKFGHEPAFVD